MKTQKINRFSTLLLIVLFIPAISFSQKYSLFSPCKEENKSWKFLGSYQGLSISWKAGGAIGICEVDFKVINTNPYDVCLSATVIWEGSQGESESLSTISNCMNCNCPEGSILVKSGRIAGEWGDAFNRPPGIAFSQSLARVTLSINSVSKHISNEEIKKQESEKKQREEQEARRLKEEQLRQEEFEKKQNEHQDRVQQHINYLEEKNSRIQEAQKEQVENFMILANTKMETTKYHGQITFGAGYGGYSINRHNALNVGPNPTTEDLSSYGSGFVFQGSLENTFYSKNKRLGYDIGINIKEDLGVCDEDPELDEDHYQRSPDCLSIEPKLILWLIGRDKHYKFGIGAAYRKYTMDFDSYDNDLSPHEYGMYGFNLIIPAGINIDDKTTDMRIIFGAYFGNYTDQRKALFEGPGTSLNGSLDGGSVTMLTGKFQLGFNWGFMDLSVDYLDMAEGWVINSNSYGIQNSTVYSLAIGVRAPW